jgi:hypothetical protein
MVPPPARRILEETRISHDFDVIVIGSGAGGGTFAYACARAGKQVLLLERGTRVTPKQPGPLQQEKFLTDEPYDERLFQVNGSPKRLYMGGTLGGSTALYGAALLRPSVEDFHPGRFYGRRIPRETWDWPISYETLEPFYTQAENLYRVAGPHEDDFGPLPKPGQGFSHAPLPVKRINQRIMAANAARGLKPFRLPLAIEFARCMECSTCPGHACPNQSRRSSAHLVDDALRAGMSLQVKTGVEAEQLQLDARGRIDGVRVLDRGTGQRYTYRARRYALAAGAIGSPALLLRSGLDGPWVGRNYMMHLSPIRCGLFRGPTGADETFVKQLGFADYYFGAPGYPHKLGLIQSLPVPGASMIAKALAVRFPRRLIAPRAGGIPNLVSSGKTGMLYHPGDLEDAVRATQAVLSDTGFRSQLGQAARAEVEGWNWERSIASVRQVYDETIHEFRHHRSRLTVGQRLAQVVTGSLILGMEKMSK